MKLELRGHRIPFTSNIWLGWDSGMTQLLGERGEHSVPAKEFAPYLELSGQNVRACPSISILSPQGPLLKALTPATHFHCAQEEGHLPILYALLLVAFSLI